MAFPLSLPDSTSVARVEFGRRAAVGRFVSPTTFESEIQVHAGQSWYGAVSTIPMTRAQAAPWRAWLAELNGIEGTFLIGDEGNLTPNGTVTGTPLVNGASQTGSSLIIDGATVSLSPWVKAGDYFTLGTGTSTRLYTVLADANSDGSGNVTMTIWPNLRSSPSNNDTVTFSTPRGTFRMLENSAEWLQLQNQLITLSFEFAEAL